MIHLLTVVGKSAQTFYLEQQVISDFKSLMRTLTSGRVMIISTKFRSDLFYSAEKSENESILKSWILYANTSMDSLDGTDFITSIGDEESLTRYFQSINALSANRYHYQRYQEAFYSAFSNDDQNPMARTIVQCDQHLIEHPSIKRAPLIDIGETINSKVMKDTFPLAMRIINNDNSSN
ncbi:MAG: hypothetical protein ABJF04_04835 [Reichenbachiella sp.]|uniref:hypothetical protein n=1 Tax=Reichenbachiella sp. TaxID=2184521 RepID=UPI003267621C